MSHGGESHTSKLFWWAMGIVGAVAATAIGTWLGLSNEGSKQDADTPSGPPTAEVVRSTQGTSEVARVDRRGDYVGQSQNFGVVGKTVISIDSVDEQSGAVVASVAWSGNLTGDGTLRGSISSTSLKLNGVVFSNLTGSWNTAMQCSFVGEDGLNCDYYLAPSPPDYYRAPQQGAFSGSRR